MGHLEIVEDADTMALNEGGVYVITVFHMQSCDGLPRIRGPGNMHYACFFEVYLLTDRCSGPRRS
eukprot:1004132-Lingulodinium_polyedra.AAC.1